MKKIEGIGLTKQRETVLRVIQESESHLTANQVFDNARRIMPGISFATIYNSLNYLKNEGLIAEIRFGTDASLYDRKLSKHDHAICSKCGRLVDIDLDIPEKLLEEAAKLSNFIPETIELTLRGLCPDCSK